MGKELFNQNLATPSDDDRFAFSQPGLEGAKNIKKSSLYQNIKDWLANFYANYIQFNTTPSDVPDAEGVISWNETEHTLNINRGGGVILQSGEEIHITGRNTTGSTLLNGRAVYISGATGNKSLFSYVSASNFSAAQKTIAVLTQDIANNSTGIATTFGIVRTLDTSAYAEGTVLYLAENGQFTDVVPLSPNALIEIGEVKYQHPTNGEILVNIKIYSNISDVTKEATGFSNNRNINVSYDVANRTVTLTGTYSGYWRNKPVSVLLNNWISAPHNVGITQNLYLYYDGASFVWSTTVWDFTQLMICALIYTNNGFRAIREVHGFMQNESHRELHNTLGTYLNTGADISNVVFNSTTAANRRPYLAAASLEDEDLATDVPALNTNSYTWFELTGAGTSNLFTELQSEIIPLSGNQPYFNEFTGGVWQRTLFSANHYGKIFVIAVPSTSDAESQRLRYFFIQPQQTNLDVSIINAITPDSINKGTIATTFTEFVFVGEIVVRYTASNWVIISTRKLTGTKISQSSTPSGNYLSTVTTTARFTGTGTAASPLEVVSYGNYLGELVTVTNKNKHYTFLKEPVGNQALIRYQTEYWNGSAFVAGESLSIGVSAGYNNTGTGCTFTGFQTGYNNTGAGATFTGYQAGRSNTGVNCAFTGFQTGYDNTGAGATFTGYQAGRSNTGVNCAFTGYQTGYDNTGAGDTFMGFQTGYDNTGANCAFTGYQTGLSNTGANCAFMGYRTGYYNQSDNNNVIGYNSYSTFLENTAGNKTFDFGAVDAATDRITIPSHGFGTSGTWINLKFTQGAGAIGGLTTGTIYQVYIIDANTLEFYRLVSATNLIYHGTNITSAGTGTGHILTPQFAYSNVVIIGNNIQPTKSNQVILGNDSITETLLKGNVGIGTTPSYNLDVVVSGVANQRIRSNTLAGTSAILLECNNTFSGMSQAYIKAVGQNTGNNDIRFEFGTSNGSSSATNKFIIGQDGQIYILYSGVFKAIEFGLADSAGTGYRTLRITN